MMRACSTPKPAHTATIEEPAQTAAILPRPAAEPATEDNTTSDASAPQPNEEKAASASAAIVVEVTQSMTVDDRGGSRSARFKLRGSSSRYFSPLRSSKCFGIWSRTTGAAVRDLIIFRDNEVLLRRGQSATDKLGKSQQRWLRDNPERLHFPFKLIEVRKMELEVLAGA
jgi:hypothetical protein